MIKKIFTILLTVCFLCVTTNVASQELEDQEGRVVSISKGETAPFSGILLDSIAGAKFIAKNKYCSKETELKLRKEFQMQLADKQLTSDVLKAQYDSLKQTHKELLIQKEKEIAQLNEIVKDEINDHSHIWFATGTALGILLSIGIFFAAVEIQE